MLPFIVKKDFLTNVLNLSNEYISIQEMAAMQMRFFVVVKFFK